MCLFKLITSHQNPPPLWLLPGSMGLQTVLNTTTNKLKHSLTSDIFLEQRFKTSVWQFGYTSVFAK